MRDLVLSNGAFGLRAATKADLPAIAAIYTHYVQHSTCTFDTESPSAAYWADWLSEHGRAYPVLVAVRGDEVVGWGSLSKWNKRCAYRFSVEDSVYVRPECQRQGIGMAILVELIRLARESGHRSLIAQIAADQPASDALHEKLGFKRVGILAEVGYKFGRWIGVGIWQMQLSESGGGGGGATCGQK
jgi:phosphinothricin acetyltransferase